MPTVTVNGKKRVFPYNAVGKAQAHTDGKIKGPCGTSKNKKNPDRCLPLAKAKSLSKRKLASTARKKKKEGAKGKQFVKNVKGV